jgi:5-bromo-4-chloroindolyl phosphate hydrolysis protein
MNSCEFREIVVIKDFEIENGILELERDIYLSIVKNSCEFRESHIWIHLKSTFPLKKK